MRLCSEYMKVNGLTIPYQFPLTRLEDLIDRVEKAKFLTKIDMTLAY